MEADKRPRMQLEDTSELSSRNPSLVDDVHLTILKELDGFVEIRKFKERDSRISALLQLWIALFNNPNKSNYIAEAFITLFRKTTVAILSPDWKSVTLTLKEKLVNAIDIAGQTLSASIEDSLHLCNMLHRTALEPWKHKSWKHILDGNVDIDDQNVRHCLAAEPEDLLLSRVQFLAHSGCERQAMSLARCCFKFFNRYKKNSWSTRALNPIRFKERQGGKIPNYCGFSSVEWFLFLLQKKNKLLEIVKETTSLTCDEGVHLIQFLRRKSPTNNLLLQTLTNVFLVRDFMFPSKYCCTKDLVVLWVSLNEKRKVSEIADAVRKLLVSYASTSAHFYLFVDALWDQFGSKLLSLYVEMYVRGLTADVNFLEVARSNEMRETVQEMETHISNVWHKLSTLFDEGSEEVARECMLSAFSMRPNQERLYILQSLTHSILSESQLRACSREEGEGASSREETERCRNRNCRCGTSCSSDAENCSAAAEASQNSAVMHPLLRRGMKGISYSCVRDLVSLLECVRCKTFQFNCFDWHKRSSELGDYLKTHTTHFEDMSYLKARVGDFNMLFRQTPDDMDTESPSDEDMDYESSSSNRMCGNFPNVSSEGISVHQSPLAVPFKLEQTSSSVWAHSKLEPMPPLKANPMFPENNFTQKAAAAPKPPTHICHSSKSTSFNPLLKSSLGTTPSVAKGMLSRSNSLSSDVGKMHLPHLDRHSVTPVPSPCGGGVTVASATEAMLRSVINNSPVSDDFRNKSNTSFLSHKNSSMNSPFGMIAPSSIARDSPIASLHSTSSNPFPLEVLNSHLKSSEPIDASTQTKQHFHSTVSSAHQLKPLSSCMPNETFASRSDASTSVQNILRTVNISNNAFPQRLNSYTNDLEASLSGSKVHGLTSPSYMQKEPMHSDVPEGLNLSQQNKRASTAVSSDTRGNMLLTLLGSQKDGATASSFTPPALNLTTHKCTDRMSSVGITGARNSCVPLNSLVEAKTEDQFSEHTAVKAEMQGQSFIRQGDSSDMQVCSRIPIPVSINTIPIGTVEQLGNHDEKTLFPAFKISMPPDVVNPFKNWFVPANLVIPKNSNPNASDHLNELNANSHHLLDRSAKPNESNVISIPGYIVFKSNKGKCLSSPRKAKDAGEDPGNAVQKKIWTSYRSSFGGVSCRKTGVDDANVSAPALKVKAEKCPSACVQESVKNNGQRCFQNTSGPSSNKSLHSVHAHNILNAQHESSQFYVRTSKSDSPLPSSHGEPTIVTASKVFSPESTTSHRQTPPLPSSVPHVISVLGKDMHPSFSTCSERKIPPLDMSVSSSDSLPLTDPQNSNKMERLGSQTVSTDKMCCSENEVVPCQSCSLSAAQAHQNDQSLKAGLSQRQDAAGIKPSGTSNMVKTFYN